MHKKVISTLSQTACKRRAIFMPMRLFSEGGYPPTPPPQKSSQETVNERQRQKINEKPEMDEKDETSFQDKYMGLKVLFFSTIVFGTMFYVNHRMTKLVQERKARLNGEELPLTEKDKINKIGGHWLLKDLEGKDFGSQSLHGNYYLLYFGFSLCPDICPLSLMKLTKVVRRIQNSKEGRQYYKLKSVFVTVNPEMDTPDKLREFCSMFDDNLVPLRETSNSSENLQHMLKVFKVPVGLNEDERQAIRDYFDNKKQKDGMFERLKFWKSKSKFDPLEGMMNDHSRVFYLMGADNRFLAFYSLEIDEKDLMQNVIEDISYDMGTKYMGTENRPKPNMSMNQQ